MSERVKTIIIAAVGFSVVALVMCLIGGFMAKADKEKKDDVAVTASADAGEEQKAPDDAGAVDTTKDKEGTGDLVPANEPAEDKGGEAGENETEDPEEPADDPEGEVQEPEGVPANGIKIAIDAGHQKNANSGMEPIGPGAEKTRMKVTWGATGVSTGVAEHTLTLTVAKKIRDELEQRGFETVMIREEDDVDIADSQRALTANSSGAKVVLHIHGNADERPEIKGIMAFVPSKENSFSGSIHDESAAVADSILTMMETELEAKNWGVIDNDTLSTLNYSTIPAIHLEVGYLSNKDEDKLLADEDYQNRIAKAVADGLEEYYGKGGR